MTVTTQPAAGSSGNGYAARMTTATLPKMTRSQCETSVGHCFDQRETAQRDKSLDPAGMIVFGGQTITEACRHCDTVRSRFIAVSMSPRADVGSAAEVVTPGWVRIEG